jgi:hypothetical protein
VIHHRARGDQSFVNQWLEALFDRWHREAAQSALVGQECSRQRHAPAITLASLRSSPRIESRSPKWASMGLAHEPQVGVKTASTAFSAHYRRIIGPRSWFKLSNIT